MQVYIDGKLVDLTVDEINTFNAEREANLAAEFPKLVKMEASRRINVVLKDDKTQRNLTAFGTRLTRLEAAGTITPDDKAILDILDAAQVWTMQVLNTGRQLIAAGDQDYTNDAKWPVAPAGIADIVAAL